MRTGVLGLDLELLRAWWARTVTSNIACDDARRTREEWESTAYPEHQDLFGLVESQQEPWNGATVPVSEGKRLMLCLLGEALAEAGEDAQALAPAGAGRRLGRSRCGAWRR